MVDGRFVIFLCLFIGGCVVGFLGFFVLVFCELRFSHFRILLIVKQGLGVVVPSLP